MVPFQGKPFSVTVLEDYALTTNAKEVEVEQFYEDITGLLKLTTTTTKNVLFIIGD